MIIKSLGANTHEYTQPREENMKDDVPNAKSTDTLGYSRQVNMYTATHISKKHMILLGIIFTTQFKGAMQKPIQVPSVD